MDFTHYVYIMAKATNKTVYTGITDGLVKRVFKHKYAGKPASQVKGKVDKLVYYEGVHSEQAAGAREKQIKAGSKKDTWALITGFNKGWDDLYGSI